MTQEVAMNPDIVSLGYLVIFCTGFLGCWISFLFWIHTNHED